MRYNQYHQPIGDAIADFQPAFAPDGQRLEGAYCILEKLSAKKHQRDLFEVYGPTSPPENWTYLPFDAFEKKHDFELKISEMAQSVDPYYFAILDKTTGKALGTVALMRIQPENCTIEVGYVIYSDKLKRTRIATEAQFLLASYVFDVLGYRRYEWKCDSLNAPSRKAALRLGFTYEGTFRHALVYKGRNRDTAWFSIIDSDWPAIRATLTQWLDEDNFDDNHQQKSQLGSAKTTTC